MGVEERLSLEAVSADTLIASEHVHRYQVAAELCAGLRVVDLACGSGYGSAILRERAAAVVGVDNDVATVEMARVTVGAETDVAFEAADAVEYLGRVRRDDWDALVCLEGIEHFREPDRAIDALAKLARDGVKLLISLPNSRTLGEENEFHVTDFDYRQAMDVFARLGEATVLYQFLAEGSLIRGDRTGELDAETLLDANGEPEYANHFIACVNFDDSDSVRIVPGRMRLAAAPAHNRYVLGLERANRELWRENARLARGRLGKSDAAAATTLFKLQRELRERAEQAEVRNLELEAEVTHLRHRVRLLDTPRHLAVERARDASMRSKPVYGAVRRIWKLVSRK